MEGGIGEDRFCEENGKPQVAILWIREGRRMGPRVRLPLVLLHECEKVLNAFVIDGPDSEYELKSI